jgi:hypothetical protein
VGDLLLDKRSDLLVEIVEATCDKLVLPSCQHCGTDCGTDGFESYYGYRVVFIDDRTEPMNGSWRAPEDLEHLNAMEVLAHSSIL